MSGCLAQKDRELVADQAPYVDVVMGTHNVHRAAELLARGRRPRPPAHRDPRRGGDRRPRDVPVGAAGAPRDDATTRGSRSRSAATTTARSASCPPCAAPRSAARSTTSSPRCGSSPRTASPRSRCSVRTSTATAATCSSRLARRRRRRPAAPAVRRPAARRRRRRRHPPRALHQPAPQGHASRDVRGDGRRRRPCASTCTTRCSRAATACWPLMHRGYTAERYLERLADARRAVPDLAVSTDIIVGFPGETDDDFERTLEVAAAAEYDYAYTFIFSPRPGTEAATMTDRFVDPAVAGERFERLQDRHRAIGAARATRRASAASRRCSSRVRARRTRRDLGPHPPEQARPLRSAVPAAHRQLRDGRDHARRAAPPRRSLRRARWPSRRTSCASPSPRCDA